MTVTVTTARVWAVGSRRFLTRRSAERHAAKTAIRDYARATGEDYGDRFDPAQYAELVAWLAAKVRAGQLVDAETVDLFINPSSGEPTSRAGQGTLPETGDSGTNPNSPSPPHDQPPLGEEDREELK